MKRVVWFSLFCQTVAFAPPMAFVQTRPNNSQLSALPQDESFLSEHSHSVKICKALGFTTTGMVTLATSAFAGEEIEMAELPPPWVPVIFALVLLVGVGVLTGSLGNVMDEEASLGLQSGARARKEIERNKSSYFKKR